MYTNNPYKQNDLKGMPHNQLESRTLIRAASMFNRIKENWAERHKSELIPALEHNRKLWTILASELAEIDHPMDHTLRQNIANLALFIFKHTIKVMATKNPQPKDIEILITINMEIARGLNELIEETEETEEEGNSSTENPPSEENNTEEQSEDSDGSEDTDENSEEDESEEEEQIHSNFTV